MNRITIVFTPALALTGRPLTDHVTVDAVPSFSITIPADTPSLLIGATVRNEIIELANDLLQSDLFELAVISLVRAGQGAAA